MNKEEKYNGHPSWHHWNCLLWASNDEKLYFSVQSMTRKEYIAAMKGHVTPDGGIFRARVAGYVWDCLKYQSK